MATELRPVDPAIWRACAGIFVKIPVDHSLVYYFPQGHVEQSSSPPILSPLATSKPFILCRILAVNFLVDPNTDEVFVKIRLHPLYQLPGIGRNLDPPPPDDDVEDDDSHKVESFVKVLTPSDANNGGGFSVPRFCADSIFPPLNFKAEPPVQKLSVTDVHGVVWEFRHIYRGTPRRHLLTTGWSKFVNNKKLIAGDSIVFMRNPRSGKLFVGVRRAIRLNGTVDYGRWNYGGARAKTEVEEENVNKEGFSRTGKGRVSTGAVAGAIELAAQDMPFEIVYYPRAGAADFVVRAEVVESSLAMCWAAGMKVKMAMEAEDSSRMTWLHGTISSATVPDTGPWQGSPWRMLLVAWDEPDVLQSVKRVSPWQVEFVAPSPPRDTAFPPTKRFKYPQGPTMVTDGEREHFLPMTGLTNSMMSQFSPSLLSYTSFPVGMQGARQDPFCISSLPNFSIENTPENFFGNILPKVNIVSTELNIGSSQSENLSPDSQSSVHFSAMEFVGDPGCNSLPKVGNSSFQLFGKIIHPKQPDESGFNDGDGCEGDGSKTEGVINQLELSSTYPCANLLDRLDVSGTSLWMS